MTDYTGRHVRLLYEGEKLSRVEAPAGRVYGYKYDSSGRLAQVENAVGTVTVKNTYDSEGRTKRQVFPDGSRMKYRYMDEEGQVELTERNGAKSFTAMMPYIGIRRPFMKMAKNCIPMTGITRELHIRIKMETVLYMAMKTGGA